MGFLFNLAFAFILVPLVIILLIVWAVRREAKFGKAILGIFAGVLILVLIAETLRFLTSKKELEKSDYYGTYVIDRDYFPGRQADWQYNTYRFEIRENDSIFLLQTKGRKVVKTYKGVIETVRPFDSDRLRIKMAPPYCHVTSENPTTYRSAWSFYLVFHSAKFNNMYFRKGNWEPINP